MENYDFRSRICPKTAPPIQVLIVIPKKPSFSVEIETMESWVFRSQIREWKIPKFTRITRKPLWLGHRRRLLRRVLLLTDYSNNRYVLWNPSTQAKTMIFFSYRFTSHPRSYGVCYDPTSDDFKVVVISSMSMSDYAVFSCKNKTWTKKKKRLTVTGRVGNQSGLCVNGFIYWVYRDEYVREIVYFDPRDEQLKILEKPKSVTDNKPIFLVPLKGCLCLYCYSDDDTVVQIWIRENDSWEELTTMEKPIEFIELEFLAEDKIVIRFETTRFVFYNISEKTFEEYDDKAVFGYDMVPYVDTLFFPTEDTRPKRKRKCL